VTLAIVSYHKIGAEPPPGDWESWYYVAEDLFMQQLEQFASAGWTFIGIDILRAGLDDPSALPGRALLLTFDDGYRSFSTTALPCLERLGHPCVLFVPTNHIGGTNVWDRDEEPDEALCGWHDLLDLQEAGVAIQSHGASHRSMVDLSPAERYEELRRSRSCLEDRLGAAVDVIAYPYGDDAGMPSSLRAALAEAGYRAGCLYGGGPNLVPLPDRYRLSRLALGPDSDLAAMLAEPPLS
jgi:peptidoglycan/xylan/chitin deacetylase (PgdA/CDA1 family)